MGYSDLKINPLFKLDASYYCLCYLGRWLFLCFFIDTDGEEKRRFQTIYMEQTNGEGVIGNSFNRVANAIKDKFGVECSSNHVEHHLRTVRNAWLAIEQLRGKSGFGWDENMKMVVASPSRSRTSRDMDQLESITTKLGAVATAISRLTEDRLDINNLYDELRKTDGFNHVFLATAFDYLVEHERLAKAFLAKNNKLRKIWLENFQKQSH
ncbi:uncharacterized protein LOC132270436 [Cornus florida]|uniref:uncharacterized protein LOC132270436 n=1 Tax=Cornus florida TaxID=4283 RepID=UPI00289C28E4|nr:uncharacterized protein LOC132270436 [Cornus florida]